MYIYIRISTYGRYSVSCRNLILRLSVVHSLGFSFRSGLGVVKCFRLWTLVTMRADDVAVYEELASSEAAPADALATG